MKRAMEGRHAHCRDQPVQRVTGGEAAPSVSKALEAATLADAEEIRAALRQVMADSGRPLAEGSQRPNY